MALSPLLLAGLLACSEPPPAPAAPPPLPTTAKVAVHDELVADLAAVRHPADGGGQVRWIAGPDQPVPAGSTARFHLRYEAGPLGIAVGGTLVFQPPPFWGWSPPQVGDPRRPGFVEVVTSAAGVRLQPSVPDGRTLAIGIAGAPLDPGSTIDVVYGGGDAGAVVDRYAEAAQPLWFAVDGDGDGVRKLLDVVPTVDIGPRGPVQLVATLPSVVAPGDPVRLTIAALDAAGNAGFPLATTYRLEGVGPLDLPDTVQLSADDHGTLEVGLVARAEGIVRIAITSDQGLQTLTNPLLVRAGAARILWADLQVHTAVSDGSGDLDGVYRYARDVAGLDAVAITDHDHWGMRFLDADPAAWQRNLDAALRWHEPGRFLTVPGFEWTGWIHGHRHVLFFGDHTRLLSSLAPATDTPAELREAVRRLDALVVPHHPAGGPIALDWELPADPEVAPVVEICSVHGQSESLDGPGVIHKPVEGRFARDQLVKGSRFGMICSTDGHDGHPGMAHLQGGQGGLAAIVTADHSRRGMLEALRARRVYGTNGVRTLLRFAVDGHPMGADVPPTDGTSEAVVRVVATGTIAEIQLIRGERVTQRFPGSGTTAHHTIPLGPLTEGEFVYVRVIQADGGMAWSSPVFVREKETGTPPPG